MLKNQPKKTINQLPFYTVLSVLLCPLPLMAEPLQLDTTFVSATGNAQNIDDVQASVQVLERKDIEQYAGHSVAEILRQATSIHTRNSGANSSIAIRGFNSNQSLILINGQRRTNNYSGNNPSQINMYDIERIEIVRGPMSSLYGADALGGVVNIITKKPGEGTPVNAQLTLGAAREGRETAHSGINLNFGNAELGHSLSLDHEHRKPFRHDNSSLDNTGRLINMSAAYRGHWTPDDIQSFDWTMEIYDRDNDREAMAEVRGKPPFAYSNYEDERRNFYGLNYQRLVGPGELKLRTSYGRSSGSTNRSFPATQQEDTKHKQHQSSATYQFYILDSHQATIGGGYNRDELEITINSRKAARDNGFLLLQDEWALNDQWTLLSGARYDRFDDFENALTPRVSLGWANTNSRARLSYGEGFRAPSLLDQYSSFTRGPFVLIQGNPNLKPEKSKSWEMMVGHKFSSVDVEMTAHRSNVKDLINTKIVGIVPGSKPPRSIHENHNIDKAQLQGVELSSTWQASENLQFKLGYEWLDAKDKDTNQRLTGRARDTYRLQASYALDSWTFTLRARHASNYLAQNSECRADCKAYNSRFSVADTNVQYRLSPKAELFAGVDNIFSMKEPSNFSSRGSEQNDPDARYFYTGVRVSF